MEGVEATSSTAQSSSAQTTILYRPSSSRTKKKKSDSDDEDNQHDYAPSSSRRAVAGRARIVFCVECKGRFVRKLDDESQVICPNCLNCTTAALKKKPTVRKRQIVSIKKEVVSKELLPSLQDICIAVVAEYIDDIETFGVISEESVEKLCKIISKNRKLNDITSRLFMEPFKRRLRLYDCTNMNEISLYNISQFCPGLEYLELVYCGHMTDKVLNAYADRLKSLKSFQISGAFLITTKAWDNFFKTVSTRLECFEIRHSARFLKDNITNLAKHCVNLRELKLFQLDNMNSDWLLSIAKFKKLTKLELAWPTQGNTLQTADVVHLLSKIGPQLTELSLKGGGELEDKLLTKGILKYCKNLKKLNLEQCHQLSSEAMEHLMSSWTAKGLTHLNIARCVLFDDKVLKAVIKHSGATLKYLNIHSLEKLTAAGVELLSKSCKELSYLDCGFIRSIDDFVMKKVIDNSTSLETVQVWGCYLVRQ